MGGTRAFLGYIRDASDREQAITPAGGVLREMPGWVSATVLLVEDEDPCAPPCAGFSSDRGNG